MRFLLKLGAVLFLSVGVLFSFLLIQIGRPIVGVVIGAIGLLDAMAVWWCYSYASKRRPEWLAPFVVDLFEKLGSPQSAECVPDPGPAPRHVSWRDAFHRLPVLAQLAARLAPFFVVIGAGVLYWSTLIGLQLIVLGVMTSLVVLASLLLRRNQLVHWSCALGRIEQLHSPDSGLTTLMTLSFPVGEHRQFGWIRMHNAGELAEGTNVWVLYRARAPDECYPWVYAPQESLMT